VKKANIAVAGFAPNCPAKIPRYGGTPISGAKANSGRGRNEIKEVCHVRDRIGGETGVKVFKDFTVAAPAAKSQVAGAYQQVTFVHAGQHRYLRVKNSM
jgi:hypothetical protein